MRDVTPDPYPPFDGVEPYGTVRSIADERAHRKQMCALGYRILVRCGGACSATAIYRPATLS